MGNNADFYQRAAEKSSSFFQAWPAFFLYMDGLKSQELKESWLLGQMCAYNRGQSVSTLDGDI